MAIAQQNLAATYNKPQFPLFQNHTFCVLGDGCLQEGVASEALSLAGHLALSKLIVIYDDNSVQIDGSTHLAFTEDVAERLQSYGFHVLKVENGDQDLTAIDRAISQAKSHSDKPTFIMIKTTIGIGSAKQGTDKVHGSPLGEDDLKSVKKLYDMESRPPFYVSQFVYDYFKEVKTQGEIYEQNWVTMFNQYATMYPELAAELQRRWSKKLPDNIMSKLPCYTPQDPPTATRKLSENVLNALAGELPELIGGSADLTASNLTRWKAAVDFQPVRFSWLYMLLIFTII